jgi:hypothetical protein
MSTAPQSTVSWLGQSQNVMDLIGRFINIKQHKQSEAVNQLGGMMKMAEAGFVPDEKAFAKYMKQAGLNLPVPKSLDDMKALYGAMKSEKEGTAFGQEGKKGGGQPQGQQQGQPQAQGMPQGMEQNKFTQGLMDAQQKLSSGKPLSPAEHSQMYLNGIAARAVQLMNTNAATEQQKADNMLTVQNLHARSLSGDDKATGTLMRHGAVPFNFDFERWTQLDEGQRSRMLNTWAGFESDAQRLDRSSNIAQSLISSGRLKNVKDAYRAADALSRGQEVPADIQMRPQSYKEMTESAILGSELRDMGVPGDQLQSVMRAAEAGGLENALPGNLGKTLNERKLELEQQRMGIEELRYQKEVEIAARMTDAERRKAAAGAKNEQYERAKELVMMAKQNKIKISEDIVKGQEKVIANYLGMDPVEVHHWYKADETRYVPRALSQEGQSAVDQFVGEEDKSEEKPPAVSPDVSKYLRGIQP